jgi:hypothetical protein
MGQVPVLLSGSNVLPAAAPDLVQSWAAGMIIAAAVISILSFALFRYLTDRLSRNCRDLISPFVEQGNRGQAELSERMAHTEKALAAFSDAMQEYAKHMASHNRAIEGLAEASQSLKSSTLEQNLILNRLSYAIQRKERTREVSLVQKVVDDLDRRTSVVLQVRDQLEHKSPQVNESLTEKVGLKVPVKRPAGCQVKTRALYYA